MIEMNIYQKSTSPYRFLLEYLLSSTYSYDLMFILYKSQRQKWVLKPDSA